jgi:hypothetical protein
MQNKANLPDAQMNVNSFITKDYRNYDAFAAQKNKANQSQSKPISISCSGESSAGEKINYFFDHPHFSPKYED